MTDPTGVVIRVPVELDDIDHEILHLLQEDARNNTNKKIADSVDVSPSTAGNRLNQLESSGVIRGYHPDIDYDNAGFPLRVLFICSTLITERGDLIDEVLDVPGVINVRELMTGNKNVQIEVVGQTNDDITKLAFTISELGVQIEEEVLVKDAYHKPASIFE